MAENVTNELLLETLKAVQTKLSRHDEAFQRIEGELRAIKTHVYGLVQSDLSRESDLASLRLRIERIERRLELND
jgi:hypothetical protein